VYTIELAAYDILPSIDPYNSVQENV